MAGSSKILTLSYGAFSCSLEGFDDPFETMKAIDGYVRDLAGDDRDLRAGPPLPDAAVLADIAGRGIAGRVVSFEHQGAIVPRPEETPQGHAPVPAAGDAAGTEMPGDLADTLVALLADAAADVPRAGAGDAAPPRSARAFRVLRVKRADFEVAKAEGLLEEIAGDETGPGNIPDAVCHEGIGPGEQPGTGREAACLAGGPDRASFADMSLESDLARIFDEADSQMTAPETSRRRNTIQQLRAALAATRAQKEGRADATRVPDANPGRGDLTAALRPRRPAPVAAARARPRLEEPLLAPLRLAPEQRVDAGRVAVRSRRIIAPQRGTREAIGQGFVAFARDLGATALPDLLEAAAAYLADAEGCAQFSRPRLMAMLKQVEQEGFSRGEGLRSFGRLLHEGKLRKLSDGRFAVTGKTRFRAEARHRVRAR